MRARTTLALALSLLGGTGVIAACGFDGTAELPSGAAAGDGGGSALPESSLSDSATGDTDVPLGPNDGGDDADGADGAACSADLATDSLNCGRCAHSCLGATCAAGRCTPATLATVGKPYELTVDATDVYWTDKGAGAVAPGAARCVKAGGPVVAVATGTAGAADPTSLVVASGRVVLTDGAQGTVVSCGLPGPGCGDQNSQTGESHPQGIAWNGTSVFWANRDSGNLRRATNTLGSDSFFAQNETGLERVAATATHVFWTVPGGIHGKTIVGANNISVGTSTAPRDVAMNATHVFVALASEIRRITTAGGDNAVVATGGDIQRIAVDASGIYFTDRGAATGRILRCPLAGCVAPQQPEVLATGEMSPFGIALDATHVYWANEVVGGTIRRVAK